MRYAVVESGGRPTPVVVVGEEVLELRAVLAHSGLSELEPSLGPWPEFYGYLHQNRDAIAAGCAAHRNEAEIVARSDGYLGRVDETELLAPVLSPGKILAIGLNYTDHVAEVGLDSPSRPHVFSKLRTALNGPRGDVVVPWQVTTEVDYEAELAMVIGGRCKDVGVDESLSHVLGYTIANDISARDWQLAGDNQLTLAKGFDGFLPLGPWIVTGDEIADPNDLRLRTRVDGELRQDASTAQMVASPAQIVSFLSQVCTLEPGDVIATGTPAGVGLGMRPSTFLRSGQVVVVEIEDMGRLENRIV